MSNHRYKMIAFQILLWTIASFLGYESSFANSLAVTKNNSDSGNMSGQCLSSYYIYLPLVMVDIRTIPEIDTPPSRWPYNPNQTLYISYKWGNNLLTPSLPWRVAFEAGLNSWNYTQTPVWYYFSSSSNNIINTYYSTLFERGRTTIAYLGSTTIWVKIEGNLYWDAQDQYTILERRGIATHEVGHGISIGHIPNEYPYMAIMYKEIVLETHNILYDPQPPDVDLVNQIYYP